MSIKVSVFIATSLDGFIARKDGIPLFGSSKEDISLTHLKTTAYDFSFVQTTYSIKKDV